MNNIFILAVKEKSRDFLANTLQDTIGEFANVVPLSCKESLKVPKQPTLVITAGKKSHEKARNLFSSNQIIMAKRSLNVDKLEEVRLLPEGKMVLVVNYSYPPTIETIYSLKELGLDHLRYVPYWKGSKINAEKFDAALSPGMIDLCPEDVNKKIDIGMRNICLSTYIQILSHLGIDSEYIDIFAQNYMKKQLESYKRLYKELGRLKTQMMNIENTLNKLDHGVVFVDKDYKISFLNRTMAKIIGIKRSSLLDESFEKMCCYLPKLSDFSLYKDKKFEIKGKTYIGSCLPLTDKPEGGFILTLTKAYKGNYRENSKKHVIAQKGFTAKWSFENIIGNSASIKDLTYKAKLISRTNSTVLLTGESGTGKELFAHAIHNESPRRNAPFIAVNFAALPESLVESELFGYEDGSFTGARKGGKAGLFELANGGTIFLDEIGDASLHTQKRLLRVLENKEIMRLGATEKTQLDVRIIAATNRDLLKLIEKDLFRKDLYFRLRVCPLTIPPLRERKSDIPLFIQAFLDKYNIHKTLSKDVKKALINYSWPGNVRELENTIEYIANMSENTCIEMKDLPEEIRKRPSMEKCNSLEKPLKELKCLFNKKELYFLLKTLSEYKASSASIGRKKLANIAQEHGLFLTENKIRTRLEYMANYGLVEIGKTRQGTLITNKGEQILLRLEFEQSYCK